MQTYLISSLPLVELWNGFSNCLAILLCFIHLSIDGVSIWQRYFKIRFIMKCTLNSDMPKALATSRTVCIFHHPTFETLFLPIAITGRSDFAASVIDSVPV